MLCMALLDCVFLADPIYVCLLSQTLADSSGEVILNIPPEVKKYACGDTGKQSETTMTPSSQTIRFGDLGNVLGSYRDTTPSVVSSETSAGTSGSHSDASLDAACGYSQYCQLIDVDDFDVDDLEMQEVILQSSSCTNIGEERWGSAASQNRKVELDRALGGCLIMRGGSVVPHPWRSKKNNLFFFG